MRTIWNGSISFGLVNIPIGLALATKPAARSSDGSFRTLHRECGTPIKQKRWCPVHDREVPNDELVKGWEVAKGQFVIVEDADLEAIMRHDESRSIDITRFVPIDDVDPVWFDRTYFLVPASAPAQRRPYVLLLEAMRETGTAALGRFIIRGTENLCLIRAKGDALVLETMFVGEDVHSQAEIAPSELVSEYRRDMRAMLEAKLAGEEIAIPEPEPEAPVVDLMEALRRSVAEITDREEEAPAKNKAAAKPRARKKAAAR